jgi:hypothetical protein
MEVSMAVPRPTWRVFTCFLGRLAATSLLALLMARAASAHDLPISYLTMVPDADYLHLELTVNSSELSFFGELDQNEDGRLDVAELEAEGEKTARRILERLVLRVNGAAVEPETCGIVPNLDTHHLTLRAHYPVDARSAPVSLESRLTTITPGSHVTLVRFEQPAGRQSARLDIHSRTASFVAQGGMKTAAAPPITNNSPAAGANWIWVMLSAGLAILAASVGSIFIVHRKTRKGTP